MDNFDDDNDPAIGTNDDQFEDDTINQEFDKNLIKNVSPKPIDPVETEEIILELDDDHDSDDSGHGRSPSSVDLSSPTNSRVSDM